MIHVRFMHFKKYFIFTAMVVLSGRICFAQPVALSPLNCGLALAASATNPSATMKVMPWGVSVQNISVTYHDYKTVVNNLGLNNTFLQRMKEAGVQVLSLGEGASDLLPELLKHGVNIKALDLWYHSDSLAQYSSQTNIFLVNKMMQYQKLYGQHLINGSALDIPLPDESQDFVLAHLLANNLDAQKQLRLITEVVRVLKPNGEARISMLLKRAMPNKKNHFYLRTLQAALDNIYNFQVSFVFDQGLLILKKSYRTRKIGWDELPVFTDPLFRGPENAIIEQQLELARAQEQYEWALKNEKNNPSDLYWQNEVRIAKKNLEVVDLQL